MSKNLNKSQIDTLNEASFEHLAPHFPEYLVPFYIAGYADKMATTLEAEPVCAAINEYMEMVSQHGGPTSLLFYMDYLWELEPDAALTQVVLQLHQKLFDNKVDEKHLAAAKAGVSSVIARWLSPSN